MQMQCLHLSTDCKPDCRHKPSYFLCQFFSRNFKVKIIFLTPLQLRPASLYVGLHKNTTKSITSGTSTILFISPFQLCYVHFTNALKAVFDIFQVFFVSLEHSHWTLSFIFWTMKWAKSGQNQTHIECNVYNRYSSSEAFLLRKEHPHVFDNKQ